MSDLLERIRLAQRDAGERVVMDDLRAKGIDPAIVNDPLHEHLRRWEILQHARLIWARACPCSCDSCEELHDLIRDYPHVDEIHDGQKELSRLKAGMADSNKKLERINMLACYASEEDTSAQAAALLEIGKLARGEKQP